MISETLPFSQSSRTRVKTNPIDRSAKTNSWESILKIHKPNLFLSEMDDNYSHNRNSATLSISKLMHPENFLFILHPNTSHMLTLHSSSNQPTYRGTSSPLPIVAQSILKRQLKRWSHRLLRIPFPLPPDLYQLGGQPSGSGNRTLFDPG